MIALRDRFDRCTCVYGMGGGGISTFIYVAEKVIFKAIEQTHIRDGKEMTFFFIDVIAVAGIVCFTHRQVQLKVINDARLMSNWAQ